MIVLDSTVLVYAKGTDHAYRAPCRELIAAIADGRLQATTTAEVIQEFAHVRARRRGRADAAALARDYGELLSPLLPITAESLHAGLRWFESTERLGAFAAVLAAAATASGATALVSVDAEFAAITALRHVIPNSDGIQRLLADSTESRIFSPPRAGLTETDELAAALKRTAGALTGVYPPGYLEQLRDDWPE